MRIDIVKLKIIHETAYSFDKEVFLEPQYFRFQPQVTHYCRLEFFNLDIQPKPTGISKHSDAENNLIHLCWFDGLVSNLNLRSESIVVLKEFNPFDFILHPNSYFNLPFTYSDSLKALLGEAIAGVHISEQLTQYRTAILTESKNSTIDFLSLLTRQIHADFVKETREHGNAHSADKTFERKKGSCRDLAWMQIHLLRNMGIAARFVSGYYIVPVEKPEYELHAWFEVYLPGAGWVGLDPSQGIFTNELYIPLAASARIEDAMPVTGTIRGDAQSTLTVKLNIEKL